MSFTWRKDGRPMTEQELEEHPFLVQKEFEDLSDEEKMVFGIMKTISDNGISGVISPAVSFIPFGKRDGMPGAIVNLASGHNFKIYVGEISHD